MDKDRNTQHPGQDGPLTGRIALVAGATRGAGRALAVELGRAGATIYVTGRTTREHTSEVGRTTETIEETAELVTAAGGTGIAVPTDHLDEDRVRALVDRIDREQDGSTSWSTTCGAASTCSSAPSSARRAGRHHSPTACASWNSGCART